MRKFSLLLSVLLLILIAACSNTQLLSKKKKDKNKTTLVFDAEKNKKGDKLPVMNFITSDQRIMFDSQIVKNQPVLFVLFNPGCGHCKELCTQIRDSISLFKEATILYLTGEELLEKTAPFSAEMGLDSIPNFIVASDYSMITTQVFEYKGIPQIMIYDKEHQLQHIFYKDASVKDILPILFSEN